MVEKRLSLDYFLIFVCFMMLILIFVPAFNSFSNYSDGYNHGYSEHNITRYEDCKLYSNMSCTTPGYDRDIGDFCFGYVAGYNDYFLENSANSEANKKIVENVSWISV